MLVNVHGGKAFLMWGRPSAVSSNVLALLNAQGDPRNRSRVVINWPLQADTLGLLSHWAFKLLILIVR